MESSGQVAQLVEHRTENPGVAGSIPALSTRYVIFLGQFYSNVDSDLLAALPELTASSQAAPAVTIRVGASLAFNHCELPP
jgi:hypothetical protein